MTPTQAAAKAPITASQHANPKSDIEISQAAKKRLIVDVARWAGTISYEILCGISRRVPRVYNPAPLIP